MGQAKLRRLKEIGLELEKVIVEDNGTVEEGKVIRAVPAAGEKVKKVLSSNFMFLPVA